MADVFISYSRNDRARVARIVQLIENLGYSVWFDATLLAGSSFHDQIANELNNARVVLVVWSKASTESSFVLDEASHALRRSRLIPILLDPVPIPLGFNQYHTLDLTDWDGDPAHAGADQLARSILSTLGGAYESQSVVRRSNVRESYKRGVSATSEQLREAKVLFVGNGGAGKTSLNRRLFNKYGKNPLGRFFEKPFLDDEPQTHGIQIGRLTCMTADAKVFFNLWDFGGQEIMHSTHQFFLSRRSLYVLVLDGRREDNAEYWLDMISAYGGHSKIIVVMNKIDENPDAELDRKRLRSEYPNIVSFHRISCKSGENVDAVGEEIIEWGQRIEDLNTVWPKTWLQVKREIENIQKDFISFDRFEAICHDHHVSDEEDIESLATHLNDLGVIVHFDGPILGETKVLNPSWATEGVYSILTSSRLRETRGVLKREHLLEMLDGRRFPRSRHNYLIELMRRFELCFPYGRDAWLVPDLLPVGETDHGFNTAGGLRYKLKYEFMPTSVFPRAVINLNLDIVPDLAWRNGCVLADSTSDSKALLRVSRSTKELEVNVIGNERADYFSIIRRNLIDVSTNPTPLNYRELVPCVCRECATSPSPHYYPYDILRLRREKGKTSIDCERSIESVALANLLSGIDASTISPSWDAFVSYSTLDKSVVSHIVGDIQARGLAVWWDEDQISLGESISQSIEVGLRKSRILIPCISRNQLASGWSRIEYTSVFNRIIRGTSTQRIAPLIIDDLEDEQIPAVFSDIRCARYTNKKAYSNLLSYVSSRS